MLWLLEAGIMRVVCSIQGARLKNLEHYFLLQTASMRLIARIAELVAISPIRLPLVSVDKSEISSRGGSLSSNLIQVLELIPVMDFVEKILD